jgi:hypothetical protein
MTVYLALKLATFDLAVQFLDRREHLVVFLFARNTRQFFEKRLFFNICVDLFCFFESCVEQQAQIAKSLVKMDWLCVLTISVVEVFLQITPRLGKLIDPIKLLCFLMTCSYLIWHVNVITGHFIVV